MIIVIDRSAKPTPYPFEDEAEALEFVDYLASYGARGEMWRLTDGGAFSPMDIEAVRYNLGLVS